MELTDPGAIKALLQRHGFRFSKSMGQNFLIADWVPRDIADAAGLDKGCAVVEVGPGIGPLTEQLAQRAGKVVSIELDRALLPILRETLAAYPNVEIVPGDVMKLDLAALTDETCGGMPVHACANLPYNITTPAITRLLECGRFRSVTVMIQREVARRICAGPESPDRGAFSLFCQYHAECSLLFDVPPDCFLPAPKVTSAVVRMVPRAVPPVDADPDSLFRLIRAAFAQRRKTLLNALSAAYAPKDRVRTAIADAGLPENIRGERLSLDEFATLTKFLQ